MCMFRYNLFFTYDCTNFCNANGMPGMPGMPELECCYNKIIIICAYGGDDRPFNYCVFFVF